jgi:hypothetical protein
MKEREPQLPQLFYTDWTEGRGFLQKEQEEHLIVISEILVKLFLGCISQKR